VLNRTRAGRSWEKRCVHLFIFPRNVSQFTRGSWKGSWLLTSTPGKIFCLVMDLLGDLRIERSVSGHGEFCESTGRFLLLTRLLWGQRYRLSSALKRKFLSFVNFWSVVCNRRSVNYCCRACTRRAWTLHIAGIRRVSGWWWREAQCLSMAELTAWNIEYLFILRNPKDPIYSKDPFVRDSAAPGFLPVPVNWKLKFDIRRPLIHSLPTRCFDEWWGCLRMLGLFGESTS